MRGIKGILIGMLLAVALLVPETTAQAGTVYQSPYVTFSPDGKAFTTCAGDKMGTWYDPENPIESEVNTGIISTLRSLKTGEHYYKTDREGDIPIGKWKVTWETGICCHDNYPREDYYYGLKYRKQICSSAYYSGWTAYCADCKEAVTPMYVYMSREAAKTITQLDMDLEYYYLCPICTNLEQGVPLGIHKCDKISWNKYVIAYSKNTNSITGGFMERSIHMFNNSTEFEGEPITPATHLTKNAYTRTGYEFIGWNTEPNGSGKSYKDGDVTWNLTSDNFEGEGSDIGVLTLYAQWKRSESTLHIDPAGGAYEGRNGISSYKNSYGAKYIPNSGKVTPPQGSTVTFDAQGGKKVNDIKGKKSFVEWKMSQPFHGKFLNGTYFYTGKDGTSDTLTAVYKNESVTLPSTEKENSSFGGWYYDPECTKPAGMPGDDFTPEKDMTLYAKWVELVLISEDNYTADGGRGAVDLAWEQKDGNHKTYLIFQKQEGKEWTKVSSAEDIVSDIKIEQEFSTDSKYTIPYSGLYFLSAVGAQGGNYEGKKGGAGGAVSGTTWLDKGDEITYSIGGQDGSNGGGKGTIFANGGGCTVITSSKKGQLLIAGGGGGAAPQGAGGAGGSTAGNLDTGIQGQEGGAGGGGGYRGGLAGEYVVHNHTADCWKTEYQDYVLFNRAAGTGNHKAKSYVTGSFHSGGTDKYGSGGHTSNGGAEALYELDWTDVKGNTTLNVHGYFEIIGNGMFRYVYGDGAYDGYNCYIKVYDQKDKLIFMKRVYDLPRYGSINDLQRGTETPGNPANGVLGKKSGYAPYNNAYWNESITLPEGTTKIRMESKMEVQEHLNGEGAWFNASFTQLDFAGGVVNNLICGYKEGETVSANPAYGGSNFIASGMFLSSSNESGEQIGDGYGSIKSVDVGHLEETSLKGVKATDFAPPDAVGIGSIIKEQKGNAVLVKWGEPKDNGTAYYHRVESYLHGSAEPLSHSNTTVNTLVSKVQGYHYLIDQEAGTVVNKGHTFQPKGSESLEVPIRPQAQYLHLAAVDTAGNISPTVHIYISSQDTEVVWDLATEKPTASSDKESVYPAGSPDTYYVRCDGVTPFHMSFDSSVQGAASAAYQVNHTIFSSMIQGGGGSQGYGIYTPSHELTSGSIITNADGLEKEISGDKILVGGSFTRTTRSDSCKKLNVHQQFTLGQEQHGKTIQVMPRAGAEQKEGIRYSDENADRANSIFLIGDGEAPKVLGCEILEGLELIDRNDGAVHLNLAASDALSGVKEFYVEIHNTDNASNKKYVPGADGRILIDITKDIPVFSGDFQIILYTKDNVGNEDTIVYGTTEFALTTSVSRILEPHTPVFKTGESGILNIVTYGYADRVEVEFPKEMTDLNPDLNTTFYYTDFPLYRQEENLQFMVPLYTPVNHAFQITVRAYKDGKKLEDYPAISTIGIDGSVLSEIRTRLR